MKTPAKLILIFGTLFFLLLVFFFIRFLPSIILDPDVKKIEKEINPFLILQESPITEANYFYGPTLDGEEILYSKRIGKLPKSKCEIYSKNINTEKVDLLAELDFHCPEKVVLSKDKDYLFFQISNAIMENIPTEKYNYYNLVWKYKRSIYSYNLKEKELKRIQKGVEKEDYTSSGGGITGINYLLIGPSPSENNKILILEENEYTVSRSFGGGAPSNYGYFNNTLFVYDTKTTKKIIISEEYEWSEYCFINCTDGPNSKYQYSLGRWSPKGDAVIFEEGIQDNLAEIIPEGGNKQYIVYLDNLEEKELKSENVRDDINICGYYYNENLQEYRSISGPIQNVVLFPNGETYLRKYAVSSLGTPTHYYYVLNMNEDLYCTPI